MAEDRDQQLAAYLAGELDAAGVAALEGWLRADRAHVERLVRAARLRVHLREVLAVAAPATAPRRPMRRRPARPVAAWRPWALAALVLVAIGGGWLAWPPPAAATIVEAGHGARWSGASPAWPAEVGQTLAPGDRIAGPCTLRLRDGSRIAVLAGAVALQRVEADVVLALDAGRIAVEAMPQAAGRSLRVVTPGAEVAVVGTRFTVAADAVATLVEVAEGRVRLRDRRGGERMLAAGERGHVAGDGLASGRVRTVAADGSRDPADHRTLGEALAAVGPGDLVLLADGVHRPVDDSTADLRIAARGRADAWITIGAAPGARPRIEGRAWNTLHLVDAAYLSVRGLAFAPSSAMPADVAGNGIRVERCHDLVIADCRVEDFGGDGISLERCDRIAVVGNRVDGCGHRSRWGQGGITVNHSLAAPGGRPGITVTGNTVLRSRIRLRNEHGGSWAGGNGIGVFNHRAGNGGADYPAYPGAITLVGNTCAHNDGGGVWVFRSDGVTVERGLFHRNGGGPGGVGELGIYEATSVRVRDCLFVPRPGLPALVHDGGVQADGLLAWGAAADGLRTLDGPPWATAQDEDGRSDFRLREGLPRLGADPAVTVGADRQ